MTTQTFGNLQRRLRRIATQRPSRIATQRPSRLGPRHDLFEPGILPINWSKSNMNFV